MPRVAAEEDALARLGAHDLAGLRVREHQVPWRTCRSSSAPKIVRKLSEWVNLPPGGMPKTIVWIRCDET